MHVKPWGLSLLASLCWQEGLSPVVEYWHIGERAPKRRTDTQVRPYHHGHAGHIAGLHGSPNPGVQNAPKKGRQ